MKSKIVAYMRRANQALSEKEAGAQVDAVVDAVKSVIDEDGPARLPGLGTFTKKTLPARAGRNPQTGASMTLPAKEVIRFKQSTTSK